MQVLVVVDMQRDFIDGTLGSPEAVSMLPRAADKIKGFPGRVVATRDTHGADYLSTAEGKQLPVVHCVAGTPGWELHPAIAPLIAAPPVDKPTFGSTALGELLCAWHRTEPIEQITLIGLCTDICVISNALLLKAYLPEVPITVDASCCAGVNPASHQQALAAMQVCQIAVENA